MKQIIDKLYKIEEIIVSILFSVMIIATFSQVINRNIIQTSIGWLEELARYSMIYMVFLGTEIGFRKNAQMSLDILTKRVRKPYDMILYITSKTITIIFLGVIAFFSIEILLLQVKSGQLSPGMRVPMYIPYFSLTILGISSLIQFLSLVQYLKKNISENGGA